MREFPVLEKVHKAYASKGLKVLAITSDELASINRVRKNKKATFTILRDPDDKVSDAYEVYATPRTFILDKTGVVRADLSGAEGFETFQKHLKKVGL